MKLKKDFDEEIIKDTGLFYFDEKRKNIYQDLETE